MKIKQFLLLLFLLSFSSFIHAQEQNYIKLIEQIKSENNKKELVNLYNNLSDYFVTKNSDSAFYYSNKALDLSKKINYKKGTAEAYRISGRINTVSGHYEKSNNNLFKALKLFEEIQDTLSIGKIYASIGVIKYLGKEFDDALEYSKKAVNIYIKYKSSKELAKVYNNIGLIYFDKKLLDSADFYYSKTIELAQGIGDLRIEISALGNSARNYMIKNEFDKAIEKFSQILKTAEKINDYTILCATHANISTAYLNMNSGNSKKNEVLLNKALDHATECLKHAEKINSDSYITYAYSVLSESYKQKGDYKNAFFYLEKLKNLQDSIFTKEKAKAIKDIEEKYKNEKNSLVIDNLQNEQRLNDERIKKQKSIIIIGAAGLLIVGVLSFFLFFLYRAKRNALVLLDEKNQAIIKQREEISKHRDKVGEIAFELIKANRTKNKFFSVIAHDLKNPFQGIIGFSELILSEAKRENLNTIEKYAENIYTASNQTYKLLENLLNYTRSQVGLIRYNPIKIKLDDLIEEGYILAMGNADKKNVSIFNEINTESEVYVDEIMISAVFRNLISNAVKFTEEGGYVKIISEEKSDKVIIKVIDTGVGIKKKDLSKLFKADLNFSTFGTQNEKGTGLGLVVCKDFVTKNKGEIMVESKIGEGSTFTVILPKHS